MVVLLIIAGIVIALDQVTKAIILQTIPIYQTIEIIPGFFNLTHVQNPGGAFGVLSQQSMVVRKFVFIFVSLAAAGLILWFYKKTPESHPVLASGFALIFGGALGNLIDRFRFGKVVDFLDFYLGANQKMADTLHSLLGTNHWPAFNVADSSITIGMVIFVYHLIFKKLPE